MSLLTALASGGIGALIAGIFALINRHLDKKDAPIAVQFEAVNKRLDKSEKDNVRMQLLLLISDYPTEHTEILEVAHHYFAEIGGDWYMTTIFNRWLAEYKVGAPEWFDSGK